MKTPIGPWQSSAATPRILLSLLAGESQRREGERQSGGENTSAILRLAPIRLRRLFQLIGD
ncbi:hypothetical protein PY650_07625 [Rhizobium calliandrae]|uniref:Uncharacterized protein n=1 Tax=Rhizobium calliandrae TaxID=1312182 RepID=A0ABT7KDU3_9HYPH|nr:hypothetical protein [Rhizobium calliandrae]MDL2405533.1 hypothetical protein [Rhizobium calliandrae]